MVGFCPIDSLRSGTLLGLVLGASTRGTTPDRFPPKRKRIMKKILVLATLGFALSLKADGPLTQPSPPVGEREAIASQTFDTSLKGGVTPIFAQVAPDVTSNAVPADPVTPNANDAAQSAAGSLISTLAQKAPWVMTLLAIVGALRLTVKPIVAAIHSYAESTATPKDDALIAKIENSKALAALFFVLDWFGSVKIRK